MQASGRVGNDHVIALGRGRFNGVKDDCRRVRALACFDEGHAGPVRPDLQLLAGGGTECITGRQHHLAALTGVVIGQLGNAGGLAHAIDADDQDHRRVPVQRHLGLRLHLLGNEVPQLVGGLLTGLQAFLVHPVAQLVHQFDGHFAAHVGQDELFFQAVVEVIVDLAAGQCIEDVAPEARAGLLQAIFHFIFFFFAKSKESHGRPPLSYAFYF